MTTMLWWLAQDTITIAVLIPIVAVACRLCRNRPAVQHVLWAVVLVKFMTPPLVCWPWPVQHFSAPSWLKPGNATRSMPAVADERVAVSALGAPGRAGSAIGEKSRLSTSDGVLARGQARPVAGRAGPATLAIRILAGLWFLGFLICTARQVRRIRRHASLVKLAKKAPEPLLREIEAIAGQVGVRPPRALVSHGIVSPFMWFLGRLSLVWPESIAGRDDIVRTRGVIAHELAHVHRGDHYLAWVELFAGLLWWWNPLFWFVRRRVRESAELACDAIALSVCPVGRRRYAELLLELSSGFGSASLAPVMGIRAGTASSFERRLSMILSDRVSGRLPLWGFVAAGALTLVTLPAWSFAQKPAEVGRATSGTIASESDSNARAATARLEQIEVELKWLSGQLEEAKRAAANPTNGATATEPRLARGPHSKAESIALAADAMGKEHWSAAEDLAFRYHDAERGYWMYAKQVERPKAGNDKRYDGKRIRLKPFLVISTSHDGKNFKTITADVAIVDLNKSPGPNVNLEVLHVHFEGHAEARDDKGALVAQIDKLDGDLDRPALEMESASVAERLRTLNARSDRINLHERDLKLARTDRELTQELFRSLLNRDPTREELAHAIKHFARATTSGNRGRAVEDIFWLIINSHEHKLLQKPPPAQRSLR